MNPKEKKEMNKNSQRQHQQTIFDPKEATKQGSTLVTCLGISFENVDVIEPLNCFKRSFEKVVNRL